MRQLERMQPTAATAATVSNMTASRPAAAISTSTFPAAFSSGFSPASGFAGTFQQVQHDVAAYIANGDAGQRSAPAATPGLTLEGMALRQRNGAIDASLGTAGVDADTQQQFLASIKPWAEETAGKLGVSPQIVAAHAALESGWGQRPLRNGSAGSDSNNLFGLKAGAGWQGAVASATTTEFEHGAALKKVERFRSYPDAASAFRDYADMLTSNPRYQAALNTGSNAHAFAHGLAQGGYATDPGYADKLSKLASQLLHQGGSSAARIVTRSED